MDIGGGGLRPNRGLLFDPLVIVCTLRGLVCVMDLE